MQRECNSNFCEENSLNDFSNISTDRKLNMLENFVNTYKTGNNQ